MRNTFGILFSLLIVLSSCGKITNGPLEARFINRTGIDLVQLQIQSIETGDLKNGKQTDLIPFETIWFMGKNPEMIIEAHQASPESGDSKITSYIGICGTGMEQVHSGKYTFSIHLEGTYPDQYLYLQD